MIYILGLGYRLMQRSGRLTSDHVYSISGEPMFKRIENIPAMTQVFMKMVSKRKCYTNTPLRIGLYEISD